MLWSARSCFRKLFLAGFIFTWSLATNPLAAQQPAPQASQRIRGLSRDAGRARGPAYLRRDWYVLREDRADAASDRFRKLIFAPAADLNKITTAESSYGTEITLGDNVLLIVTNDDAKHAHVAHELLAKYYVKQIRDAINLARQQHSKKFLIRAASLCRGHAGDLSAGAVAGDHRHRGACCRCCSRPRLKSRASRSSSRRLWRASAWRNCWHLRPPTACGAGLAADMDLPGHRVQLLPLDP